MERVAKAERNRIIKLIQDEALRLSKGGRELLLALAVKLEGED